MSIEYVIETSIKEASWLGMLKSLTWLKWIIVIWASAIGGGFLTLILQDFFVKKEEGLSKGSFYTLYGVVCVVFFVFLIEVLSLRLPITDEKWEEEIAQPYYENLPVIKKEIEIISINGTKEEELFEIHYIVTEKDGRVLNKKINVPIIREEGRKTISYEYKEIQKNIPNFKEKGKYEEVLRVPVDFELNGTKEK